MCVWSIFWPPFHHDISNLSKDLDFLGQVWCNKTICNMKRWERKILLSSLFSFYVSRWRITLGFHVRLCVWSIFWSPSHHDISNLSTHPDSLGQDWSNKNICKVMGWEMKKKLSSRTLFFIYMSRWRIYFSISRPFVCLINVLTLFPSRYFKSKHRFGLLGSNLR